MERRIIDNRKKEKYMIDDEYLNGQARLCGWQGTIVYMSLCRHVNKNQESFPSIKLMAEQHNLSRPTIIKGIENLEKRRVIEVKKSRTKDGKWLNNTYILTDKSEWDYTQVNVVDLASQVNVETCQVNVVDSDQVNVVDTKETHIQGNTYKETHFLAKPTVSQGIPEVIFLFKSVNPSYRKFFGNNTQRSAAERLSKNKDLPFDVLQRLVVEVLPKFNADKYVPGRAKSITPLQFEDNLGYIKAWMDQQSMSVKKREIISDN